MTPRRFKNSTGYSTAISRHAAKSLTPRPQRLKARTSAYKYTNAHTYIKRLAKYICRVGRGVSDYLYIRPIRSGVSSGVSLKTAWSGISHAH